MVTVEDVDVPTVSGEQLLIRVEASSLNALDHHMVTGTPLIMRLMSGLRRPKRTVVGGDVAGTVVATGPDVQGYAIGDHIVGLIDGGGCSEYARVMPAACAHRPSAVSANQAAATPIAGLTALQGLRTHAGLQPGDSVLINGAAGGVGTFAVQIAAAIGAHVTAVCSGRNVEMVRSLGAHDVIDYTTTDLVATLVRRNAPFDVVFDNVGNLPARHLAKLVGDTGRVVLTTGPKRSRLLGPIAHMIGTTVSFTFRSATFTSFTAAGSGDDLATLMRMIADGDITPQIDRVIGLDDVPDGLAEIATGHTRAKIVVRPDTAGNPPDDTSAA